jgi:hypothetical protein
LTTPVKVIVAGTAAPSAQCAAVAFSRTVSTPDASALGVKSERTQDPPVKPVSAVTVGVPVNVVGNPTLMDPPTGTALTVVNPAVHVALAP